MSFYKKTVPTFRFIDTNPRILHNYSMSVAESRFKKNSNPGNSYGFDRIL